MNLNLLSYLLFFPLMLTIAVWTAQVSHRHGRVWLLGIFHGEEQLVDAINNVLLAGCYALNLGYIALSVTHWEHITDWTQLIGTLVRHSAIILLSLAAIHFTNIGVLLFWSRQRRNQPQPPENWKNP